MVINVPNGDKISIFSITKTTQILHLRFCRISFWFFLITKKLSEIKLLDTKKQRNNDMKIKTMNLVLL